MDIMFEGEPTFMQKLHIKFLLFELRSAITFLRVVNYHNLKDVACDYAKSRVAYGRLTLRPD